VIETAVTYPQMKLTGIDISWRMIEYARAQAQAHHVSSRTGFLVMDALQTLTFPDDSFDLVNARACSSFLHIEAWPRFLHELLRVARPGGIVRVTEGVIVTQSTSPALMSLVQMSLCAAYKAGYSVTPGQWGITKDLERLLSESGCQQVQTRKYILEHIPGTVGGQHFYQNMMYGFQTVRPFIRKWDCLTGDYDTLYQQMLVEMQQKDFYAQGGFLTAWGTAPARARGDD
jgi:ubiquinone/menaquinone biosynthesis C-methylase UbiE